MKVEIPPRLEYLKAYLNSEGTSLPALVERLLSDWADTNVTKCCIRDCPRVGSQLSMLGPMCDEHYAISSGQIPAPDTNDVCGECISRFQITPECRTTTHGTCSVCLRNFKGDNIYILQDDEVTELLKRKHSGRY